MRNKRISILILSLLLLINIFSIQNIFADEHKVESSDINVFINNDGSARITERRIAYLSEGTENYIVIKNLGESTIKDFVVKEDGRVYDYVDNWNIDASRSKNKFKNGIIDTCDGYELSWGIGEYGRHDYTLEYTITDFIKELQDGQILFWRFINDDLNVPPENVTITIESEQPFNQGEEEIYAFGYDGEINFVDGKIIAKSNEPLISSDYVTILVGLPEGMFTTNDYMDTSFQEIKDKAFIGSDYGSEDDFTSGDYDDYDDNNDNNGWFTPALGIFGIIGGLFAFFPLFIIIIVAIFIFSNKSSSILGKFKRRYKEEYYRDYPYEGDLLDAYHILHKMGVGNFENLLTSFILKWINEDRIMTEIEEAAIYDLKYLNIKG